MARLRVRVEQDHLERLVRRPMTGLCELIWNALDADATEVDVDITRNRLGGVDTVTVTDNGVGMTPDRISIDFQRLGGSWKKLQMTTDDGRRLHGQAGQGRFGAFALGEMIRWVSVADAVDGERVESVVTGHRQSLQDFDATEPLPASQQETGTRVEVSNLYESARTALERDDVPEDLAAAFALYLEQYPVTIRWRGRAIDPSSLQTRRELFTVWFGDEPLELVIIEWSKPTKRALHLCDEGGVSLHELPPGVHAPGFQFTAYLKWDGFREMQSQLMLEDLAEEPLPTIIEAARSRLREYFKNRANDRGLELVKAWKADHTYPYAAEPATVIDHAERQLFDILAVTAAPVVEDTDSRSRRLSLRLLREAIEKSPGTVHEVLREVLDLPEDRMEELRQLIRRSSLGSIIAAARQITDRLDFLQGLEAIIFNEEHKERLLERSQLHRMLARETWVFREEYALTADDVTLRTALRSHISLLGREDLAPEETADPVLDQDGHVVVVDMMLSRVTETKRNEREHIVIELKRPTVHIGMNEFMQIQRYASTVAADARFAQTNTTWQFWIVGDEIRDPGVLSLAHQANREPGILNLSQDGKFVIRAVTWAQLIQDARHRLSFVREAMDYAGDTEHGLDYLRRVYSKYLPGSVTDEQADHEEAS